MIGIRGARLAVAITAGFGAAGVPTPAERRSQPPTTTTPVGEPPAQQADIPSDLESELRTIDVKAAAITDLVSAFEQTKASPLLKKPLVSKGTVRVKGPHVRWDTKTPRPTTLLVSPDEIRVHYPDQSSLEVYPVDDAMRQLTASPIPRLAVTRAQFRIARAAQQPPAEAHSLTIDLSARTPELRERIAMVRVTIDRTTGLATRIEITDADDESTTITFSDARVNTGLDDREFELVVPDGTRVSRPLEGVTRGTPAGPKPASGAETPK